MKPLPIIPIRSGALACSFMASVPVRRSPVSCIGIAVTVCDAVACDFHTAGEPFRIVADPPVELGGDSVADRRARAIASPEANRLRQLLCYEPRGHADMYGAFLVPPDDGGADIGVLFWHKDGFSTACGHGTIALGAWAVESGRVAAGPPGPPGVGVGGPPAGG